MEAQVRSVRHALAIMRLLAPGGALTLSEIARACALSPSSCLSLLRTLVAERVLTVAPGKRYALAPAWGEGAARWADPNAAIVARARPLLTELARAIDAPIGLWQVVPRGRLQLVALGESAAATRIHMVVGQRQPIGGGAAGRALAAAQEVDDEELAARFAGVRWEGALDFATYRAQVAAAARDGYAVDERFGHAGIRSLAAVVPGTEPALCVSASFFADAAPVSVAVVGERLRALGERLAGQHAGAQPAASASRTR